MTQEKIIEGNKLIAEFMGAIWGKSTGWEFGQFSSVYSRCGNNLKFHLSWDWLMPVVEKIISLNYGFNLILTTTNTRHCVIYSGNGEYDNLLHGDEQIINIVWKSVVEFIKWYNNINISLTK
jgi:hypothetical protein